MNSLGSADVENEKYLNSIEGHIAQFQAQFQATTTSILDSEFLKGAVDTGSGLLGAVQWLTENLGAIPGLIAPITSMLLSSQNLNIFGTKRNVDGSTSFQTALGRWREYSQSLQKQTEADVKMLRNYFEGGQKLTGEAFEQAFASGSSTVRNYAKNIDVAANSTEQLNLRVQEFEASQKRLNGLGSRIGNFAMNLGANLLASFGSMAALTTIMSALSGLGSAIDGLILSSEEAAEITSNVSQAFQQSSQEIENNISTAESLRDRFDELSKGVSDSGKNVSLSADEYKEYQDIVSQLTGMTPKLIQGYNSEGDAIIDKNNAIQQTIDLLKEQQILEAKETAYGSKGNDGGKTNFEAAYLDFESQYADAQNSVSDRARDVATQVQRIYSDLSKSSTQQASELQNAILDAVGVSYEDFRQKYIEDNAIEPSGFDSYIWEYADQVAAKFPQILSNLRSAGSLTGEVAAQVDSVYQGYLAAEGAVDGTADSLRTLMQAVYESNEGYYDLGGNAQGFLEMFRTLISADKLKELGADGVLSLTEAMVDGMVNNTKVRSAASSLFDWMADKDNIPIDEYADRVGVLATALQDALGIDIDLSDAFGIEEFEQNALEIISTIKENFSNILSEAEISGSINGEAFDIDLNNLEEALQLYDLTTTQLSTLNNVLVNGQGNATQYAATLAAAAQVGALPEFLDRVSQSIEDQIGSFETVQGAISEYQAAVQGLVDGADTHESMVSIYDQFAQSVNKGQINTEEAREQMQLLIGDVVSLEEAKQWVAENEGLFLTGTDEEKIGQDLTGIFNTLHSKYNQMNEDQQKLVDSLMNIDWDTGSIQVAQNDVVALADAFGISAASMQQALDLISSYSDYVSNDIDQYSSNIQSLNDGVYSLKQSVSEADRSTTIAWDHLSTSAKVALESLTEGMNIDLTSMTVSELDDLTAAFNKFKGQLGETPTADSLTNFFNGLKTSAGEAAAEVERLQDGSWSINVTSLDTFSSALGVTNEQAQILLTSLQSVRDESGNPISVKINGEEINTQKSAVDGAMSEVAAWFEKTYGIKVEARAANAAIDSVQQNLNEIPESKTSTIYVNTVYGTTGSPPSGSGGGSQVDAISGAGYAGITGKMRNMAAGGQSRGGRTLVGELGRELWISRDGKRQRVVGNNGMEIIRMQPGDAIVPNNITEQLIRGGMSNAAGGTRWNGINGGGALSNLQHATGGKYYDWNSSGNSTATIKVSADTSDAEEAMEDALKELKERIDDIFNDLEHEIYLLQHNGGGLDEILARYKKIQEEAHRQAEQYRSMGLDANSEYIQDMQKQWWDAKDAMADAIAEFYEPLVSDRENAVTLTENWLENAITDGDVAKAEKYANDIIGYYTQMQNVIHEQADYYRSLGFSDTSDEVSELSDQWWEYAESIKDVKQQVIDGLSDIVSATSDAIDSLQDVFDTLKDAADEYAETGGFISVDSFQAIMELGPEYMQYLRDENGLLAINEESINRVIAAKTEQLALENAMAYVERLRMAAQDGSIEDLNQLLYATEAATNASWGLVYANLAMAGLNGDQYEAALHNINAIYSLAQNVKGGVGIDFDSMKSGVDDLVDYVMDMIRDQTQEQIDALEEMKDKYAEIIQLKKDSLEASREESDYQESVAEQIKEISDLQMRINLLSLDDSRSAQAQKAQLEEQLAELQKQLSDDQAEHAYDNQVESLDKMQEAYEKEKDKEIEVLEDSISSTQKLYTAAIEYIKNNWNTLYDELIAWNTKMGSSINAEITEAWKAASEAVKQYGGDVEAALNQYGQGSSGSSGGSSGSSNNDIVGDSTTGPSNERIIGDIVSKMEDNAAAWHRASAAEQARLDKENDELGRSLSRYGINAYRKGGVWYFDGGKRLFDYYHAGGIAGSSGSLKQREMIAVLEKGEAILDQPKQNVLMKMIDSVNRLSKGINNNAVASIPRVFSGLSDGITSSLPAGAVTSASAAPSISFGDTIIYGADDSTVKKHQEVNRKLINEVLDIFHLKK